MGDDGDKMDVSEGESSWATDDEDFPSDNDVDCMLAGVFHVPHQQSTVAVTTILNSSWFWWHHLCHAFLL